MAIITKDFLTQIGVNITDQDIEKLSEYFETTLDKRVMDSIVTELDDTQLANLEQAKNGTDEQLIEWLNSNVPALKDIIEEETDILLGELAEHSDGL